MVLYTKTKKWFTIDGINNRSDKIGHKLNLFSFVRQPPSWNPSVDWIYSLLWKSSIWLILELSLTSPPLRLLFCKVRLSYRSVSLFHSFTLSTRKVFDFLYVIPTSHHINPNCSSSRPFTTFISPLRLGLVLSSEFG